MSKNRGQLLFLLLLILAMVFWGISWPIGKIASGMAGAPVIAFWRFLLSFFGILPVLFLFKQSLKVSWGKLGLLLISGALLTLYNNLFFGGLKLGLAGAGGVLVTTTNPLFTALFAGLAFKTRFTGKMGFGFLLGLAGGLILLEIWQIGENLLKTGNLFFLLSALSWALLTLVSQRCQRGVHFVVYSLYTYGFACLIQFVLLLAMGEPLFVVFHLGSQGPLFWWSLLYLSLIAIAFSTSVYFLASRRLGSHRAGSFVFIVPSVALVSSIFILQESPGWATFVGGALSVGAVYLINAGKVKKGAR